MGRLITNKEKQKAVSDPTEKPNKYMKNWTARKIRSNVASEIEDQISNCTKSIPGKDRLAKIKRNGVCPVCENKLQKNDKKTRYKKCCHICGSVLQSTITCFSCGTNRVWVGKIGSVCKGCGKKQI